MIIHASQIEEREDETILESVGSAEARLKEEQPTGLGRGHRIVIAMAGAVLAAALVAIVLFIYFANSSVKGTVHVSRPTANQTREPRHDLTLAGQYIRFKYTSDYISQNSHSTLPGSIEQHVLLSNGFVGKQLAVVVSRPIEPALNEYSAYKYRYVHPELYSEKPLILAGSTGSIMIKNDGTEETAFISHNGLITTLSFTLAAADNHPSLDPEVQSVIKSFAWVQ